MYLVPGPKACLRQGTFEKPRFKKRKEYVKISFSGPFLFSKPLLVLGPCRLWHVIANAGFQEMQENEDYEYQHNPH